MDLALPTLLTHHVAALIYMQALPQKVDGLVVHIPQTLSDLFTSAPISASLTESQDYADALSVLTWTDHEASAYLL